MIFSKQSASLKQPNGDLQFYAQMLSYLESGFPLFVAMNGYGHAVVAAGYNWRTTGAKPLYTDSHVWSQVDTLLSVGDNFLPYDCVTLKPPVSPSGPTYTAQDFDVFIVPLPEKIYYPADAMESYSQALYSLLKNTLKLPEDDKLLRRYFITIISALRRYARKYQSQMGDELVNLLMRLNTPQFIWVVEYTSDEQWAKGHIAARAIVDATASPRDPLPVWLSHDEQLAIVFDRSSANLDAKVVALKRSADTPLGRMEQNLQRVSQSAQIC